MKICQAKDSDNPQESEAVQDNPESDHPQSSEANLTESDDLFSDD